MNREEYQEGDRVTVAGPHPWAGYSGVLESTFKTPLGQLMWRVNLDNGMLAGVVPHKLRKVKSR